MGQTMIGVGLYTIYTKNVFKKSKNVKNYI